MSYFFPFSAVNISCVQAPFISISKEIVLDNVKLLLRKKKTTKSETITWLITLSVHLI